MKHDVMIRHLKSMAASGGDYMFQTDFDAQIKTYEDRILQCKEAKAEHEARTAHIRDAIEALERDAAKDGVKA